MTTSSSRQQTAPDSADALGSARYQYRYPFFSKVMVFIWLLSIPLATAFFLSVAVRAGDLSSRVVPGLMGLILIAVGAFLAYRQAYFAWSIITIHEQGLRFDFWNQHVVIPWTNLGKFYLGPGRAPKWHVTDKDERILCELKDNAVGRAVSASSAPSEPAAAVPSLTKAIIEQGNMTLYETPFKYYFPAPRGARKSKQSKA